MASISVKRAHAVYISSDEESNIQPASGPSPKRARSAPDLGLTKMITSLPITKTQALLSAACTRDPALAGFVREAYRDYLSALAAEEAAKPPVNFDHYSRSCWHALNNQYKGMSSSRQYTAAFDVSNTIDRARNSIMKKAGKGTKWETRRNALEVLRKICKSIMLCDEGVIKHETLKDGMMLGEFAECMVRLVRGMNEDERRRYREEGLWEKLVQLRNEFGGEMEGLNRVYDMFEGEDDGEDDEEEVKSAEDEVGGSEQEEDEDSDGDY